MTNDNIPDQPRIEGFELPEKERKGGLQKGLPIAGNKPGDEGFDDLFNSEDVIDHDLVDSTPEFTEAAKRAGFLPEVSNETEEFQGESIESNQMSPEETVRYWGGYCQRNFKISIHSFARDFDSWYAKYTNISEGDPAPVYAQRMIIKLIARAITSNAELAELVPDKTKLSEIAK